MPLDINYNTTNPRNVDKILEGAIEEIQAGAAGKVFTPDVTDAQRSGTVDATQALLDCAAALTANGGGTFVVNGNLQCNSSIILPVNTNIEFTPGSSILTRAGGTFISNALFLINCSNGTTWDVQYPNVRGYARNVKVDNSTNPSLVVGVMRVGVPIYIENIFAQHCHFTVRSISAYLDHFRINGAMHSEPQGTAYPIELANLGDGLSIRSSHAYLTGGEPNNIRLTACQGGEIQGAIGGNIYINQCRAVKVHGCHQETGQILIDGSDCSIEDTYFWVGTLPGIKLVGGSGGNRRTVSIRDVVFMFRKAVTTTVTQYDIQVSPWYNIQIQNCTRSWGANSNAYDSEKFGVFLQKGDNSPMTVWNNYAYSLSKFGQIGYNEMILGNTFVNPGTGTVNLVTANALSSEATFQGTTGTYFYQAQLVYDAGRQLGQNTSSAEVSVSLTNGGQVLQLTTAGYGLRNQDAFYRLYRGTATGSYNFYVDIPLACARTIVDRGDLCSGFPWIARTAGAMTAMQDITNLQVRNTNVTAHLATIPPTVGTWVVGDDCFAAAPAASGFRATTCTAAPSTHKTWGAISA